MIEKKMPLSKPSAPRYSVCVCNFNMGDTIERALTSVLEQLDDRFEMVVVDDGSTDNSLSVLRKMEERYPALRVIALPRDKRRQLGETRNFSIKEARGEYVLLHVDADDEWESGISAFVEVFHRIECCLGRELLVKGWPLQIAKREFLLRHGPYRNVNRSEDGDMWMRLAAIDAYIHITQHRRMMRRLPRPKKSSRLKTARDVWYTLVANFRMSASGDEPTIRRLVRIAFMRKYSGASYKVRALRMALVIPAYLNSLFQSPLRLPADMHSQEQFLEYCERTGGTFREIMERQGCNGELEFLPETSRSFFEK